MNDNELTSDLIKKLNEKFKQNKKSFFPYIEYIRFPSYKRLEFNSIINFNFPITILVGRNGSNKTSVLQALYGCPNRKNVGEYWFSTEVDKINKEDRNCFIYGYYHEGAGEVVELLKTRINKKGNPDYWEPSRAVAEYGMKIPSKNDLNKSQNKNGTRWDLIKKPVLFSDCKEYVSAYDLFFYHHNFIKGKKIIKKQDYIRLRSKKLSEIIKNNFKKFEFYGKNVVKKNEQLNREACKIISDILEEDYREIKIVTHDLYNRDQINKPSRTIWMKKNNHQYSEAFAGTGESRVILLVNDILKARKNSLILIDEPEISLHPSAIIKLKNFILNESLHKNHQVIITTHSTHFIEKFPDKSIKVLENNGDRIAVKENINFTEAFYSIGSKIKDKRLIYVEDRLMKYIVDRVIKLTGNQYWKENIEVISISGGAKTIIKNHILSSSIGKQENVIYILDGDQKTNYKDFDQVDIKNRYYNWYNSETETYTSTNIANSEYNKLNDFIKLMTGMKLDFTPSGNKGSANENDKIKKQLEFIDYWENNVFFLNFENPEKGILQLLGEDVNDPKKNFRNITIDAFGDTDIDGNDIFSEQRRYIGRLPLDNEMYNHIRNILEIVFKNK
ncbi:AAA family ATPase [Macrococcus equi]|uniref:AAA family ATPase n=1 Tax=Macrococcus equi TaxID=3395462 RepID=UPI0039BE4E86